jgi:hypothetical protein
MRDAHEFSFFALFGFYKFQTNSSRSKYNEKSQPNFLLVKPFRENAKSKLEKTAKLHMDSSTPKIIQKNNY